MTLLDLLRDNPLLLASLAGVFGLMVGSFLNVVIHRLPIMMERDWRRQCAELLGQPAPEMDEPPLSLSRPRSRCPNCGHQISAAENIPVLSFLFLKGKCSSCGWAIPIRYPVIETATALLSVVVVMRFGFTWESLFALGFTWTLLAASVIDFDHQLLPDDLTLPLLWAGLALSLGGWFVAPTESIIGAMAGYLSLWSLYKVHKALTGREGMGYGDFKLLGALGAWMGWQALPVILLFSSLVGALVGIGLIALRGRDKSIPIPFGPYLAAAGWITLMWGDAIIGVWLGTPP
ncbi:MAG: prepilin peptidase [Chromatiales bacterium]|nr:prepilin peptidase [Chromatiales bacterium]